jgi:hypothetical protein
MNNDNIEHRLKELFTKHGKLNPHDGFTDRVMGKINDLPIPAVSSSFAKEGKSNWIILTSVSVIALIALIYYFSMTGVSFFSVEFKPVLLPVFEKLFTSFKGLLGSFKISSVTIIIILSIISVFAADQLIRRFQSHKNSLSIL